MPQSEYHFITEWIVEASCEEVYTILGDADSLKIWWPSVYLDTKILKEGDNNNVGKVVLLYTKGWLPYTLRWSFMVTETNKPLGFTIQAHGDFLGKGIWVFEQTGKNCRIVFDWKIAAEKPILKKFSFLLKPIFSKNHQWAMRKGEESLKLELLRRRALTEFEIEEIPKPPPPIFPHNFTKNHIL